MARIFISHSRRDKDIIALFDRIFAGIEAARVCMELGFNIRRDIK